MNIPCSLCLCLFQAGYLSAKFFVYNVTKATSGQSPIPSSTFIWQNLRSTKDAETWLSFDLDSTEFIALRFIFVDQLTA